MSVQRLIFIKLLSRLKFSSFLDKPSFHMTMFYSYYLLHEVVRTNDFAHLEYDICYFGGQ